MLADRATDRATLKFSIRVPAAVVNEGTEAGHLITVKFTHLPGYETEIDLPIIRRNVVPTEGRTDMYDIHLECSGVGIPSGPGGGDPGPFPEQDTCDIDDVDLVQFEQASLTTTGAPSVDLSGPSWGTPPTPGNLLVYAVTSHAQQGADPGDIPGWDAIVKDVDFAGVGGSGGAISVYSKIAEASEDTTPTFSGGSFSASNLGKSRGSLFELAGVDSLDSFEFDVNDTNNCDPGVDITPTAGLTAYILTVQMWSTVFGITAHSPGPEVQDLVFAAGNPEDDGNPITYIVASKYASTSGTYDINPVWTCAGGSKWASVTMAFYCSGSASSCPAAGVWRLAESPTMTGPDGETACPFADGSLHVFVDQVEQTNGLVAQDGAAGTFTLGFTPTPTEVVTVDYQGR